MTLEARQVCEPLRIYVLWHPDNADGTYYAQALHRWFSGPEDDLNRVGLGIPVFYRSQPWEPSTQQPRQIDLSLAGLTIVVPLVDEHLVTDMEWRRYLSDLVQEAQKHSAQSLSTGQCMIYPVALHLAAYNLPEEFERVNFLRVDRVDDPVDEAPHQRCDRRRRRLLSLLTQVCCRLVLGKQQGMPIVQAEHAPPPISLFISHAKVDGSLIAALIRDHIHQYGQIKSFYDENDLAIGYIWDTVLQNEAQHNTAAMIVVVTDAYASRPWCRREIRWARRPSRSDENPSLWRLKPLLVVDALEKESTNSLSELGRAPVRRWHREHVSEFLDALLYEVLLHAYHYDRAKSFAAKPGRCILNSVPDVQTMIELMCVSGETINEVIYPGLGVFADDREEWRRLWPNTQLKTFEEAEANL